MDLALRFDYCHVLPWVRCLVNDGLSAVAHPDVIYLRTPVGRAG